MARMTPNGCPKAQRKRYRDLESKFRATPCYLATIDFGSTHCSVAYLLQADSSSNPAEGDPTLLKLDDNDNTRVPSCILFNTKGEKIALGYEAREQFYSLDHEMKPQFYYFENVKKEMQHEEV